MKKRRDSNRIGVSEGRVVDSLLPLWLAVWRRTSGKEQHVSPIVNDAH